LSRPYQWRLSTAIIQRLEGEPQSFLPTEPLPHFPATRYGNRITYEAMAELGDAAGMEAMAVAVLMASQGQGETVATVETVAIVVMAAVVVWATVAAFTRAPALST
ncbi:MAG: hypothetical protein M1343_07575, partial [Chloroflexi bacterium]|nr:hypothetical protein [Chloroflexota bacterium]